jgi:hypothetical protein
MDESARVVRVAHRANLPVNESRNDIYLPLPCLNRYVCAKKKGKKKKTGSVPEKKKMLVSSNARQGADSSF